MPTYQESDLPYLLNELSKQSTGSVTGKDAITTLQSLILVRTAEMVGKQLTETGSTIGRSANALKEVIEHSTSAVKGTLENSSNFLIAALKVSTETGTKNAENIEREISSLTEALAKASTDVQNASAQSADTARTLNRFTSFLAIGTLLLFFAACWQALESHRQADLIDRQLQIMERSQAPAAPLHKSEPPTPSQPK